MRVVVLPKSGAAGIFLLLAGLVFFFLSCKDTRAPVTIEGDSAYGRLTTNSTKRGLGYGYHSEADMAAITGPVSWWYNWSPNIDSGVVTVYTNYMEFVPMAWNAGFNESSIRSFLSTHPDVKYLLGYNEPNFQDQANMTPAYAASQWPILESIASDFGLGLVSPAVNYCGNCVEVGGVPISSQPQVWLDMFTNEYHLQHGQAPVMDYIALHFYVPNLGGVQSHLNNVRKYGKPIWVTEFANWSAVSYEAQIDFMEAACNFMENDPQVFRYAWFMGRWGGGGDPKINIFDTASGSLTPLGRFYLGETREEIFGQ